MKRVLKMTHSRETRRRTAAGKYQRPLRRDLGVSMVEVLVAVVVLSIGLLGLAGLQASGMRVGQSSIYRSQAAQLSYDMIDRMRVNIANTAAYSHNLSLTGGVPTSCAAAPVTAAEVAQCDLQDWRRRLQTLPGGTGSVDVSLAPQVTIIVQWDDTRGAGVLRGASTAEQAETTRLLTSQFQINAQLSN